MSEPNSLIVDVTTGIKPGMVYVMLSRVCSIEQLFIVNKIDPEKIRVHEKVEAEVAAATEEDAAGSPLRGRPPAA